MAARLSSLVVALVACSDAGEAVRSDALAEGRSALRQDDASGALHLAKSALHGHGEDPALALLAAEACLRLQRRSEALAYAERGLAAESLEDTLRGDLQWARGTALIGRYKELGAENDWRGANTDLESASRRGNHQAESATLLMLLQDLGGHSNDARRLDAARRVLELEPAGELATKVRTYMASKGVEL